ncbi:4-hydroxy-tetrahydrodipicolinate synthase [Clostridium sp. 'deep sea']|uniref:4-hydroxy-tetrahydrodipicolinate synthase n=1 Tax=Clostridium sp. 'deep sea' TaxID=2779445 RepID=UPI0018965EB5|nr:4-hydroxy-tetrahydrodipicolinate synthase [Clostridium sp. 'deep sea']QOR34141.1 4-hydroxy-tetrahydrodipicolinate synthase [Clostridium sp. 'deep sea']
MLFKGSGVAIVTPFIADKTINYNQYQELLEWHIKEGTDCIVVCGTTGEASAMTTEEQQSLIKFTVEKVAGRIPVVAGTGSNNTKHAVELSQYAESVGVDGLLVINPYYNRTSQQGIIEHFKVIADSVNTPIIVYNVPSRTGCNITAQTVKQLANIPNIVAIKEASGNISQIAEIARICPSDFIIYSGNDDHIVPVLSLGGQGVITVVGNILPKETSVLVHEYLKGNTKKALEMQLKMNGVVKSLFLENNPIPVKKAMQLLNLCSGELRLPLVDMQKDTLEILKQELNKYNLL